MKRAMDHEAVQIMKLLVRRGATRATLVRLAAAAARSVLPLVGNRRDEAMAAVESAERWAANPNETNAKLAENEVFRMLSCQDGSRSFREVFGLLAARNAALACFNYETGLNAAVFAVECAAEAASGREVDLGAVITVALL